MLDIEKIIKKFEAPNGKVPFLVAWKTPAAARNKLLEKLNSYSKTKDEITYILVENEEQPTQPIMIFCVSKDYPKERLIANLPKFQQKNMDVAYYKNFIENMKWIDNNKEIFDISYFPILEVEKNDKTSTAKISLALYTQVCEIWNKEHDNPPFNFRICEMPTKDNVAEFCLFFPYPNKSSFTINLYRTHLTTFYKIIEKSLQAPSIQLENELKNTKKISLLSCDGKPMDELNSKKEIEKIERFL